MMLTENHLLGVEIYGLTDWTLKRNAAKKYECLPEGAFWGCSHALVYTWIFYA
jgi:hypothetical protein